VTGADRGNRLRSIPLFAELSGGALERLAAIATEVECPAGMVLALPGDPGSGMFVIEEGIVVVELRGRDVELGPGEFFGELALLVPDSARVARVRAKTNVRCLAIARADFTLLLEQEPRIAVAMLPVLAGRLAQEVQGSR
jgi:CRP-like cAMP-binding protein